MSTMLDPFRGRLPSLLLVYGAFATGLALAGVAALRRR